MSKKLLLSLCAVLLTVSAFGQTADELLEKNLKAMGGKDKLKGIQSMRLTGKMKMGPMEAPITIVKARPSEMRVDFTIQGMTGTSAYDGSTGWNLMPFMGNKDPQKMTEEQLKDIRVEADFDGPTFDYKAKGNKSTPRERRRTSCTSRPRKAKSRTSTSTPSRTSSSAPRPRATFRGKIWRWRRRSATTRRSTD
jgi:hypothetical protein